MRSSWRSIAASVGWWLGLAGHVNLVYTFIFGGAAALVITTILAYATSFFAFVSELPLLVRVLYYASVLVLSFALVNHGWLRIPAWWTRLRNAPSVPPEIEVQQRWREQDALDRYFAEMRQWLDKGDVLSDQLPPDHPDRKAAQEDTTRILSRLSPEGKREVVSFLHGRNLIKAGGPIISLVHADLSSANLSDLGLREAAMSYAYLGGADLSDAKLSWLTATGADMARALTRRDASVSDVMLSEVEPSLPIEVSHLIHCDLSRAVLRRTKLAGCILHYANFAGAELEEADLRAADLRGADNLTQEQIESAYGSRGQEGIVDDTLLPDHLEAPLKWKLTLKQQQEARQRKR